MSQSDLSGKIGVAQVQKYENGANRVGASRLSRIAAALGISIGDLFEPSDDKPAQSKSPFQLLADRDALRVLDAFSRSAGSPSYRPTGRKCRRSAIQEEVFNRAPCGPKARRASARTFGRVGIGARLRGDLAMLPARGLLASR
jgi:transcriptional regulator with XRE-family HTH domain